MSVRSNNKLQQLIKGENNVKYIKSTQNKMGEYLRRMEDIKLVKEDHGLETYRSKNQRMIKQ